MMFTFFISFTFPLAVYSLAGIQSTELLLILAEHQETIRQCTELMHIIQSGGVPDPIFLEEVFMKMMEYQEALGLDFDEPWNLRTIGHFKATYSLNLTRISEELVRRGVFRS